METVFLSQALQDVACDTLIVGATRVEKGQEEQLSPLLKEVDGLLGGLIKSMYTQGEFKGSLGETSQIYTMGKLTARRIILTGLGPVEKLKSHTFRRATGTAVRFAKSKGAHNIALALGNLEPASVQAAVEGALLATYSYKKYITTHNNASRVEKLQFISPDAQERAQQEAFKRGLITSEGANFARDLVNEQPAILNPSELANRASAMARQFGLECTILEQQQMQELGMGGLLAVTSGSAQPPRFIILRYRGAPEKSATLALVGKGVTFDSGGLSLKTGPGMESMKGDMGGGAAVIGAMQIIAASKPAINVLGLVPASENMPDGASFRPGDILRLMNGKTIEILNTDAEGRLLLADALSYAVREGCSPIVDIATLTGACVVALGAKRAGLFTQDNELRDTILAAGEASGEKFWPMPLDDDYQEYIESSIADIKQTGGRYGGAITAAKILEHFSGNARWAHLDIAGMEFVESKPTFMDIGASGFGARALAELVFRLAEQ